MRRCRDERLMMPDEIAETVWKAIEDKVNALGLRGRKRREFIEQSMEWWRNALRDTQRKRGGTDEQR